MAKLNSKRTGVESISLDQITSNEEGEVAYKYSSVDRLIERVLGAFWGEDLFYTKAPENKKALIKDIEEVAIDEPKFILQLAAYARNEMYMRTTPQVLLVHAANIASCKPYVREYAPKIVKRADELSEVIAYQLATFGKPIPNSLKKGLADAFARFDEYQLNKYDSDKKEVKLGDVLRLVSRRKDYPVSQAMYNYLVHDEVSEELEKISAFKRLMQKSEIDEEAESLIRASNATWETVISKFGSTKENWERVIPNMGYMALLRNLRNFEQKDVQLNPVIERLVDPEQIKRSKQLPFRFLSAYNTVSTQKVKRAVAKAFEQSITNVTLDGTSAIMVDLSGSMNARLSEKSAVSYKQLAATLGAIATKKAKESIVIGFGDTAEEISLNPDDTMMTNIHKIEKTHVGLSTNAHLAFDVLGTRKVDRVILISDMQCYDSKQYGFYSTSRTVKDKWNAYRKTNRDAYLYSLDISAYGTKQVPYGNNRAILLSGWSDRVMDFMQLAEDKALVNAIRKW